MTFRHSMIAAAILLSSTVAQASAGPTSTDEARGRAGLSAPATHSTLAVAAIRFPGSSDEARSVAAWSRPTTSTPRATVMLAAYPSTTDEARAQSADGGGSVAPSAGQEAVTACAQACSCSHG